MSGEDFKYGDGFQRQTAIWRRIPGRVAIWRQISEADFNMEADPGGGFQYGGRFLLDGGRFLQNLLFCIVVLQQEKVYISIFNQGACICARSFNFPNGIS
jgi:hypothetical protein